MLCCIVNLLFRISVVSSILTLSQCLHYFINNSYSYIDTMILCISNSKLKSFECVLYNGSADHDGCLVVIAQWWIISDPD